MTREEIIAANPIVPLITRYGIAIKQINSRLMISCPFHKENTPSCSIDPVKNVFYCFGCQKAGGVIDFVAGMENLTIGQAMRKMGGDPEPQNQWHPLPATLAHPEPTHAANGQIQAKEVAIYSYRDALGVEVFQVVRYEPKTFRQRHMVNSEWVWNMDGVARVLYNLPKILKAKNSNCWYCEGEKDCDNLSKLGFIATTNVGGAGKWIEGYSESLKGKDVILCGDNDATGQAHVARVLEAIAKEAKTVRVIRVPLPSKDVSDYIATFNGDNEAAAKTLFEMSENATVLTGGIEVPVDTMEDLERQYIKASAESETTNFDIGLWLPELRNHIRPLVPGEVFLLLAGTGTGKTAALQNIAIAARHLNVLLFEMELPGPLTFERFAALSTLQAASFVADEYRSGRKVAWRESGLLNHIVVCTKSGIDADEIERIIVQTELKTGKRPQVVEIDYHQLLAGKGKNRYERASHTAEQLKVVAKRTNTIVIVSSQISRKNPEDSPEVKLSDGRDSGSLEQSCGLAMGLWRDTKNSAIIHLKILKNTKGKSGHKIECDFDGRTMSITQRSPVADVPSPAPRASMLTIEVLDKLPEERLPYADP